MRRPLPAPLLVLGLLACDGSLYDAAGVPVVDGGGLVCSPQSQHACGDTCRDNTDPDFCGTNCVTCPASPANGARACLPVAGGNWGCTFTCAPGYLPTATACERPTAVATGAAHACAVTEGGSLVCWGANGGGQLGSAGPGGPAPVLVLSGGVTAVAAGGAHTCAVQGGAVLCWGANQSGQLGRGTTSPSETSPLAVAGLSGVTALSAGTAHTCALAGGQVRCWGANGVGQVGTGTVSAAVTTPATAAVTGAAAVASGGGTTCALLATGTVRCWGANASGQAGAGNQVAMQPAPVTVPLGAGETATAISVGGLHACATLAGKGLRCWGSDAEGQLGDAGAAAPVALAPVWGNDVDNNDRFQMIATGGAHVCGERLNQATIKCGGRSSQGQTGTLGEAIPGGPVAALAAGLDMTCALTDLATPPAAPAYAVKCWGANGSGQLGRPTAAAFDAVPGFVGQ